MKIKIIFRNGTTEAVLADAPAGQDPDVEIVNIDDDYPDYDQLQAHAEEIYADPSMRHVPYETANFE